MAACYETQRLVKFPFLETLQRLHEETKLFCLWEESIYFKGKSFAASWSLLGIGKVLWIQSSVCVSSFLTAFDLTRYWVAKAEHICSGECGGLRWIETRGETLGIITLCAGPESKSHVRRVEICFVWDLHTMTCCTVNPRKLQWLFASLRSHFSDGFFGFPYSFYCESIQWAFTKLRRCLKFSFAWFMYVSISLEDAILWWSPKIVARSNWKVQNYF